MVCALLNVVGRDVKYNMKRDRCQQLAAQFLGFVFIYIVFFFSLQRPELPQLTTQTEEDTPVVTMHQRE